MVTATSRSAVTFFTADIGHTPCKRQHFCQAKKEATGTARPDTKTGRKNRSNSVRTQNLQVCYWILLGPCFM